MTNHSSQKTGVLTKIVNMQQVTAPRLSDDAFYLLALASRLKELLGPASLSHFLTTGETVAFTKQAS